MLLLILTESTGEKDMNMTSIVVGCNDSLAKVFLAGSAAEVFS
jgi:hypothetical protein